MAKTSGQGKHEPRIIQKTALQQNGYFTCALKTPALALAGGQL